MKILIILTLLSFNLEAIDCKKNRTACQIIKNAPEIEHQKAIELSNIIIKIAKKHNIPIKIFTAIIAQESRYNVSAKNCTKGYRMPTNTEQNLIYNQCMIDHGTTITLKAHKKAQDTCESTSKELIEDSVCTDLGITQIHIKSVKNFNFDINKLLNDEEYSIEAGAMILSDFKKRYSAKEANWWTRYNSSDTTARETYKNAVSRWI